MSSNCRHHRPEELQTDKELRSLAKKEGPFLGLIGGPERMRYDLSMEEELRTLKEVKAAKRLRETYAGTATMEVRQSKVFRLRGDMEPVTHGIDRSHEFQGVRVALKHDLMPSATGRGVRSSAFKVERAAMYVVRAKGSGPRRGPRVSQVVNEDELAKALAEIGG